mgnify:CR=1 FL=1
MIREKVLPKDINKKMPSVVKRLEQLGYINALFFFGGFVRQGLKPLSDIDIAVLFTDEVEKKVYPDLQVELAGIIEDTIRTEEFDLIILNNAPLSFAYRILRDGMLVFAKNRAQLIDFREMIIKYHLDFQFYRKIFDKSFLEKVGYHG